MSISQQFSGLPMKDLIGSPLSAAADASINLANSTADFINRVGFDKNGKVRNVAFQYEKFSKNDDGTMNLDAMKVDVPMLAIVPIPNLQVDEVNILFDMEVKESEKSEKNLDVGGTLTGKVGFGWASVSVSGSVSVHQANTRSSDNSAKYHVDVRAANHGTPEGLSRVLDMMAANVAPSLVGSTLKDSNGQDLSGKAKERAEKLKSLRADLSAIEQKVSACQNALDTSIIELKRQASSQLEMYRIEISDVPSKDLTELQKEVDAKTAAVNAETDSEKKAQLNEELEKAKKNLEDAKNQPGADTQVMSQLEQIWAASMNLISSTISTISESDKADIKDKVSSSFGFKGLNDQYAISDYDDKGKNSKYSGILSAQNNAIDKQKALKSAEDELLKKQQEYNTVIAQ